jgi:hypothetical protein
MGAKISEGLSPEKKSQHVFKDEESKGKKVFKERESFSPFKEYSVDKALLPKQGKKMQIKSAR